MYRAIVVDYHKGCTSLFADLFLMGGGRVGHNSDPVSIMLQKLDRN